MFKKWRIKKKIKKLQKEIDKLEYKRLRSQSVLINALITRTIPEKKDIDFFNNYTNQINEKREQIINLKKGK